MRGCSGSVMEAYTEREVFPAYAGMFLHCADEPTQPFCFPRVCGDVPKHGVAIQSLFKFSPRMRGCS